MIELTGTLHRQRLRDEFLPCAVCHEEIDYAAPPGAARAFRAVVGPQGRLVPTHYHICSTQVVPAHGR